MGAPATAARITASVPGRAQPGAAFVRRVRRRVTISQCIAHLIGAGDVIVLLFVVLPRPRPDLELSSFVVPNLVAALIATPFGIVLGAWLGRRVSTERMGWLIAGREPDAVERGAVLRLPNRCFKIDAGVWLLGAAIFAIVNLPISVTVAAHVAVTIVLGGMTTCGIAYLLMERDLRPVTDLALASGPPATPVWPGVQGRVVLAWLLATGAPLIGIVLVGLDATNGGADPARFGVAVVALALIALLVGFTVLSAATRTVTRPLAAVREALGRVQGGDLTAGLRIDDGSEVGLLQSGFNSMVTGLREREQLRGLYARQVGEEVAAVALADEPRLGGETRHVAVLFVDLVGSTAMAARTPPQRVVARLNAFFAVVVEVVAANGGWVNKFEGDAALCIFGAPAEHPDAAGGALAAARELQARMARDVPDLAAGIGVSCGDAVAGWIGARERFEYTVIGDPVNVAARLCELAKRRPEGVLATARVVAAATSRGGGAWAASEAVVLRGHDEPTPLAVPG